MFQPGSYDRFVKTKAGSIYQLGNFIDLSKLRQHQPTWWKKMFLMNKMQKKMLEGISNYPISTVLN